MNRLIRSSVCIAIFTSAVGPALGQSGLGSSGGRAREGPGVFGSTTRVSVSSAGAQGIRYSFDPSISADGRFVAFKSLSRLVPGDTNGVVDIYVRDRSSGSTERVSVDSAGAQVYRDCWHPSISADGRHVAFHSSAPDLVPLDTNGRDDVFVRDRWSGTTERVSVDSAGNEGSSVSGYPSISADGRFVAFTSSSALVSVDTNGRPDVFVRDRWSGTTERVSVASGGAEGDSDSLHPSISADGRFVGFSSYATNLVSGDTNDCPDVFVRDRWSGTNARMSVASSGAEGDWDSFQPSLSADGRHVAFWSAARNLVPGDTNALTDVFVHDRLNGTTERESVDSAGAQVDGGSWGASLSGNGRFVVFHSTSGLLVSGDTNGSIDVFVRDRRRGTTERVSIASTSAQGNDDSYWPSISADGRCVAFYSYATDLVLGDTNGNADVFVRER